MGNGLTKEERQAIKIVEKSVKKWRTVLQLDPLWDIDVEILDDDAMEGALARVDTSNSEYFVTTIEISGGLAYLPKDKLQETINEMVCHELIHIVMIDLFRTMQLIAGDNENWAQELRYKYEQFTSRFQRAFVELDKQLSKAKEAGAIKVEEDA